MFHFGSSGDVLLPSKGEPRADGAAETGTDKAAGGSAGLLSRGWNFS
jgi:hypothetical protein